jgi:hypothetical protein
MEEQSPRGMHELAERNGTHTSPELVTVVPSNAADLS